MQSFINSNSSCAEQYGDMFADTQTHSHTNKPPMAGVQLVGHNSINCPITSWYCVCLRSNSYNIVSHHFIWGCQLFRKKRYECVRFNVISITRGWVGVEFPKKLLHDTWLAPLTHAGAACDGSHAGGSRGVASLTTLAAQEPTRADQAGRTQHGQDRAGFVCILENMQNTRIW